MKSNIEAERARLRLTREALCQKLGITSKTYSRYINGNPIPSPVLIKMAKLFECSTDYLLGIKPSH